MTSASSAGVPWLLTCQNPSHRCQTTCEALHKSFAISLIPGATGQLGCPPLYLAAPRVTRRLRSVSHYEAATRSLRPTWMATMPRVTLRHFTDDQPAVRITSASSRCAGQSLIDAARYSYATGLRATRRAIAGRTPVT